jgi:hypothetical protein
MPSETSGIIKVILSILLFPLFFQDAFITFAWGAADNVLVMSGKRLFLLLPVCAFILGCWVTIACLLTVIFRQSRREFITALIITWWDLGKSIVSFWGGIFKFLFNFFGGLLGLIKLIVLAIWVLIKDILFLPFRLIRNAGQSVVSSSIPWIAVFLTLLWCLIEAVIFTYVMTPLVVDTFSNITGEQLTASFVRIPLFVFLLFIVLGSYAVLSTMVDALKSKNISAILGIGIIELITLFVEVVFLYREFVDSLVPWFAQNVENFQLGAFWTLAIAGICWLGVRLLSWVLFAAHGTPTIMAIIQGKGLKTESQNNLVKSRYSGSSSDFMKGIKADISWLQEQSEEIFASFILPPLQVIGASINFCVLLIASNHLFEIPFKDLEDIKHPTILSSTVLTKKESKREGSKKS